MKNNKLSQGVKELRKRKGLSQEDLAKNSGLSLRTIQRVENGETDPTGETLRRISGALDVTPTKLIDWDINKESLKNTIKTKNEYLHIFDNKLIISTTPKISDLVDDYEQSVNNLFKSLMVFFVFIPIFTILTVIFYNMEKLGLAIYAGSIAFLFLTLAFYSMLFTSGSSLIKMKNLNKIKIQKSLLNNVVVIFHKESGRIKKRCLILEKNQVDTMKNILLSEKLIKEKDIKLKENNSVYVSILIFSIISFLLASNHNNKMWISGFIITLLSGIMIATILIRFVKPLFNKTTDR